MIIDTPRGTLISQVTERITLECVSDDSCHVVISGEGVWLNGGRKGCMVPVRGSRFPRCT